MGLLPFPSTYEQLQSTAEAWGSCSPLYFDVPVVVVCGVGIGVGIGVGVGVDFTLSPTAVTCWVCSPSPVLQSNIRVQQKLGVVALPYTLMFMLLVVLANTIVYVIYIISWEFLHLLHLTFVFSLHMCS